MNRRPFLIAMSTSFLATLFPPKKASAQVKPFLLHLVRDTTIAQTLNYADCITGKLYHVREFKDTVIPTARRRFYTLELPYRNNLNNISAIPEGIYKGSIRTNGKLGWRIEFEDFVFNDSKRTNIQIHPGNKPKEIRGCILLGLGRDPENHCNLRQSRDALNKLKTYYKYANNPLEILVKISS